MLTSPPLHAARPDPGQWRVKIDTPPISVPDGPLIGAFARQTDDPDVDAQVKVVVFESADPDHVTGAG